MTGLEEAWTAPVYVSAGHPTTSDAAVHVSAGDRLYGFDTETGDRLWFHNPEDQFGYFKMGPATFSDGVLWSGGGETVLTPYWKTELLDPATGEVVGEPVPDGLVDGVRGEGFVLTSASLYIGLGPGWLRIHVRDSEDPGLEWRGAIAWLSGETWSPLTLGTGFVYQAGEGPPVDEADGNGIRAYSTKEKPDDCPTPDPPYDSVGPFTCPTWFTSLDGYRATSPVLDSEESSVFVGTRTSDDADGTVYALDATAGEIVWSTPMGAGVLAEPAVANGNVYVPTADGRLVVLDAGDGDLLWEASAGDSLEVQPAVAGGVVVTGAEDGSVQAFDAAGCGMETCEPLWSDSTGSEITGAPAVSEGQLYVGTADGRLIAYGLP